MLPAILAVDGGNSKTDVALIAADGTLLAVTRGPTISHQAVGIEIGMARLATLIGEVARAAGLASDRPIAERATFALAGADFPSDLRLLRASIGRLAIATDFDVVNDTRAALRAGSRRPWGIALICGQGINAVGVAPSGRVAGFDGVGDISGDWGGGGAVGMAGHAAAVRGRDGRGERTTLEALVPAHFGLATPAAVVRALYDGRIPSVRLGELAPIVFQAASSGDGVARSIVDRLADELATMATALIRRLRMGRLDADVVLAGGVFRTTYAGFYERLADRVAEAAPDAVLVRLDVPPVMGAALIGLDARAGGATPADVAQRLRAGAAATAWHWKATGC